MNSTTNTDNIFYSGRPCVPVDGDVAAQEEQSVSCLGSHSINSMKAPVGELNNGLSPLPPNETTSDKESHQGSKSITGKSSVSSDVTVENAEKGGNRMREIITKIKKKRDKIWSGIGRKQGIKIATLNINGRRDERKKDKWPKMTNLMRSQGIAVLGLQESHLDDLEAEALNETYPKLTIVNNGASTSKEGVTFVLNKDLTDGMRWKHTQIIDNRASLLEIEIEKDKGINIVLVYTPNADNDKISFWTELYSKLKEIGKIENVIILGDFNSVEDALDRYPHRDDDERIKEKWKKIRNKYKLIDGWRLHNPEKKDYTYLQKATKSMSRIDRVYMDKEIYMYGYNWEHVETALSDHNMVTVEILKTGLPFVGKGVWRMYQDDIENKKTIERVIKLLEKTETKINMIKKNETEGSIQVEWYETKKAIKNIAVEEKKKRTKQLEKEKKNLKIGIEKRLEKLSDDVNEVNEKYQKEIDELKTKLKIKIGNEQTKMRLATRARYRQKGEKCTKYWFGLNKERKGENIIIALKDEDNKLTRETRKMGEIAVNHHETLQKRPEMTKEREKAIEEMMKIVKDKKIGIEQKNMLQAKTSREEIEKAIKNTANGTSPGIDGIPYELYKEIIKKEKKKEKGIDVIGILHNVINDIEENGVTTMSSAENKENEFTDGLMFLLYKKKDKCKIENYRPITLLNTDYKIYTKTIANRLAIIAPTIINEDQAGFIPNRSLYDHTKTTQLVVEYCEIAEKNGCIIALDQEKAYDKIDHDYLWIILEEYGFPATFIKRIKEMYRKTEKAIMINGIVTKKYSVERGVHQGDPMSCLLYDLAIEPLAEALRKSKLKGIKIKENIDRLLVNLFADDTLVYMREGDNMEILDKVIKTFCTASTAKFNMDKTEILPVGSKEFRKKMIETRKMGINVIANDKKIVKEGESMRTLGSWVGNEKNDELQWERIIKEQEGIIQKWGKMNLTSKGKELVLKSLVQSKAVFLATVNGMPIKIEEQMKKMYHSFLWEGKAKGLMKWDQIIAKRSEGGLGIPDITARVEAIEIMWLKRWLSPEKGRPKWAYIMDMILSRSIAKQPMIDKESRLNWLIQSWHESEAKEIKLSSNVKRILKAGRKYNITPIALKYDIEAKRNQPLWHNLMIRKSSYQWNKKSSRCLRQTHNIKTIGDIMDWDLVKNCSEACNKMTERLILLIPELVNPLQGTPKKIKKAKLDLTPKRLKKNKDKKMVKLFNPDITTRKNWEGAIRIFAKEKGPKTRNSKTDKDDELPAYRSEPGERKADVLITIVKKGRKKPGGEIIGIVRVKNKNPRNIKTWYFKMREEEHNTDEVRATAIIWMLKETKGSRVVIRTDDMKMVNWIGGKLEKEEDEGWLGNENADLWKMTLNKLRKKGDELKIMKAKKDSRACRKILKLKKGIEEREDVKLIKVVISKENRFVKKGAKLEIMTQKRAYELIINSRKEKPGGLRTEINIERIKEAAIGRGTIVKEKEIWRSLKNIYSPQIVDFIWKMIHGRIKCGPFFRFIPNWQEKEFCACGASESIEHILTQCEESGQIELWNIIKEKWEMETGGNLIEMNVGIIMGVGLLEADKTLKMEDKYAALLLRKLIAMTIWTIWKERNDRVFNDKEMSPKRLQDKWEKEIRKEIRLDLWEKTDKKLRVVNIKTWTTNGTFAELRREENKKTKLVIKIGKQKE